MRAAIARLRRNEEGFTLVELLAYSLLLVVVMSLVFALFMTSHTAERTVRAVTAASTSAQLTADSIETGIRNSSAFRLTVPTGSDQLVVARVARGTATVIWTCVAWYYSAPPAGEIRYTESSTAINAPSSSTLASWTQLTTGVTPPTGATAVFTVNGTKLSFAFKGTAGTNPPAYISSSAVSRTGSTESPPCF